MVGWLLECILEGRKVKGFRAGKWYRWTGSRERPVGWNETRGCNMDPMLDRLPHKCLRVKPGMPTYAMFDITPNPYYQYWDWSYGIENFRKVGIIERIIGWAKNHFRS